MKNNYSQRVFKRGLAFGLICLILFTPSVSFGWGAGGHMMVAQIAFGRLNPKAKAQVQMLLAIEINPAEVTKKSTNFINASHWADDLRPFTEFDFLKPLHFIDKPFTTDGTMLPTGQLEPDNIVKALEDNVNILKTSTDKNEQALALRLIIHFVGDIHQPLHAATRVTRDMPEGDRGGNSFSINIPGANGKLKKTNLHSFWDSGIGSFPPTGVNFKPPALKLIPAAAAKAKRGNPASDPAVNLADPFNFMGWADESFALAKDVAYKNIANGATPTAAYKRAGTRVVRKRVAWGGYRLAALLNSIWPE